MATITAAHTIVATCDARQGFRANEDGYPAPLWCGVTIGLRSYVDTAGFTRRYCAHHEDAVRGRWPERYVSEIQDDPLGQAKARWEDRDEMAGTACWYAGHVPYCPGRAGGEHELLPGWVSMEIDGETVEVEVS